MRWRQLSDVGDGFDRYRHRGPNFKARRIFFDFQNTGRQDATRESITGDDSLQMKPLITAEFYTKPLNSIGIVVEAGYDFPMTSCCKCLQLFKLSSQ